MSEAVILLHGLGRTARSMRRLARKLSEQNYFVWNESYPSTRKTVEVLSETYIPMALQACSELAASKVHFVTHSLGGILLRHYLQAHKIENLGNIVMLAPPNKGSEVADRLKSCWAFRIFIGPAGQQLGTEDSSLPNSLSALDASIGVIAGNRSSDPWFNHVISKPHDGKVSVESAKLLGMRDFIQVDCGHTFIMNSSAVIKQVQYFLKNGCFEHDD